MKLYSSFVLTLILIILPILKSIAQENDSIYSNKEDYEDIKIYLIIPHAKCFLLENKTTLTLGGNLYTPIQNKYYIGLSGCRLINNITKTATINQKKYNDLKLRYGYFALDISKIFSISNNSLILGGAELGAGNLNFTPSENLINKKKIITTNFYIINPYFKYVYRLNEYLGLNFGVGYLYHLNFQNQIYSSKNFNQPCITGGILFNN